MVSVALAAAGGALAGSVVTGAISYYNTLVQERRQDTRERAGFYIERKVELLTKLHERLSECYAVLTPYISPKASNAKPASLNKQITAEQVEEINTLSREVRTLILKSQLYLTVEEKNKLQWGLMSLNHALATAAESSPEIDNPEIRTLREDSQEFAEQFTEDLQLDNYHRNIYISLGVIKSEVNEPIEKVR
jgi:hypothetical protein